MDSSNENHPRDGPTAASKLSEPSRGTAKHNEAKSDAGGSSSYAISNHGETTDLRETLALRPHLKGSARTGESKASDGDREKSEQDESVLGEDGGPRGDKSMSNKHATATGTDKNGMKGEPKVIKEYSAEARTYHAYYDELQRAHLGGHYTWCHDHCLNMLSYPRIPLWTRIQTLQLLSTMLEPSGGQQRLGEADQLIDILDPNHFQTQLLREDNRKMKADREEEHIKNNMTDKDVEGAGEDADGGSSDERSKLDRELDEKLRQELEEEMGIVF